MNFNIIKAAKIIDEGGVVAFPTETVYGLGADATNDEACMRIFEIKGRPSNNPLIVHVATIYEAKKIGEFNEDAYKLSKLWPGPLTIVMNLKNNANIAKSVLAGLNTVALRIPSHSIAQDFLRIADCPIAAPSANISGYISSTKLAHVQTDFPNNVFILENEDTESYGLESTIVDVTAESPTILRTGKITLYEIEQLLGKKAQIIHSSAPIKAPGMMDKHYSPKTLVRLNADSLGENEIGLNFYDSKLGGNFNLSSKGDLNEAAANLYDILRKIDKFCITQNIQRIAISPIPLEGIGHAINDRLKRAAVKSV